MQQTRQPTCRTLCGCRTANNGTGRKVNGSRSVTSVQRTSQRRHSHRRTGFRWRNGRRDDSGQALAIVIGLIAIIIAVPTAIVSSLSGQVGLGARTLDTYAALSAAEAGLQNYRNLLDEYQTFWEYHGCESTTLLNPVDEGATSETQDGKTYTCSSGDLINLPPTDETDAALTGWYDLTGSPAEAFTYSVNTSQLEEFKDDDYAGTLQVIITGKAGSGQATAYRTIQGGYQLSGVLTDSYYSNYEQPNPADTGAYLNTSECEEWTKSGSSTVLEAAAWTGAEGSTPECGGTTLNTGSGQNSVQCGSTGTAGSYCQVYEGSGSNDAGEYEETTGSTVGGTGSYSDDSWAQALCIYHEYSQNSYIESLGGSVTYDLNGSVVSTGNDIVAPTGYPNAGKEQDYNGSTTADYFDGPWFADFIDPSAAQYAFAPACSPYYFDSSESFDGPVFTNDEIVTCGSPTFGGTYTSAVSKTQALPSSSWPGADSDGDAQGYVSDPGVEGGCGETGSPDFDKGTDLIGNQMDLPSVNTSFEQYASASSSSDGCLYTGPTQIYFQTPNGDPSDSKMWVWSPLSINTGNSDCGGDLNSVEMQTTGTLNGVTCSTSKPCVNGDFVEATPPTDIDNPDGDGVIYVQSEPSSSTDPNYYSDQSALSNLQLELTGTSETDMDDMFGSWTCLDPADPSAGTSGDCDAGDLFVSGVIGGQLTLATETGNVYITRQLGIECALESGGALSPEDPETATTSISACNSGAGDEDVLGIVSDQAIWVSHPINSSELSSSSENGYACTNPDNAVPADSATETVNDTSYTYSPADAWEDVVPDCDLSDDTTFGGATNPAPSDDPVIDAALVSLTAEIGIQNFDQGDGSGDVSINSTTCADEELESCDGGVFINGTDVGNYRGTFGEFSGTTTDDGYNKELSFDNRLYWLSPPHFIEATGAVWDITSFDDCAISDSATPPTGCSQ